MKTTKLSPTQKLALAEGARQIAERGYWIPRGMPGTLIALERKGLVKPSLGATWKILAQITQ